MSAKNVDANVSDKETIEDTENIKEQNTAKVDGAEEQVVENKTETEVHADSEVEGEEEIEVEDEATRLHRELSESKDKYLRLSAEFDNYRRRTLKEKMELTKTAGENLMIKILPVVDDFERAMVSMKEAKDCSAIYDGLTLIYNKFNEFLKQQGVSEIEAVHKEFDTDLHEAITKIPAPKKKLKGKVVDVVEKGYKLHDKVIRFSKVVIGE